MCVYVIIFTIVDSPYNNSIRQQLIWQLSTFVQSQNQNINHPVLSPKQSHSQYSVLEVGGGSASTLLCSDDIALKKVWVRYKLKCRSAGTPNRPTLSPGYPYTKSAKNVSPFKDKIWLLTTSLSPSIALFIPLFPILLQSLYRTKASKGHSIWMAAILAQSPLQECKFTHAHTCISMCTCTNAAKHNLQIVLLQHLYHMKTPTHFTPQFHSVWKISWGNKESGVASSHLFKHKSEEKILEIFSNAKFSKAYWSTTYRSTTWLSDAGAGLTIFLKYTVGSSAHITQYVLDTELNESTWPLHGRWVWFGCGPNHSFERQIESEGVIQIGLCIYSFEKWDLSIGTRNPGNFKIFSDRRGKKQCHLCYRTERLLRQQLALSTSNEARACKWLDAILR